VVFARDRGAHEQVQLIELIFPTAFRHASPWRSRRARRKRLASMSEAFQPLADFAKAFAMRAVVRAAVRG
jgi:hypothetical protein